MLATSSQVTLPYLSSALFICWTVFITSVLADTSNASSRSHLSLLAPFRSSTKPEHVVIEYSSQLNRSEQIDLKWQDVPIEGRQRLTYNNFKELAKGKRPSLLQIKPIDELISSVLSSEGNHLWPALSPDGRNLAYVSLTRRRATTWMYNFGSESLGRIQGTEEGNAQNSGISSSVGGLLSRLQRKGEGVGSRTRVASDIAWSNDSKYYAFVSSGKIFIGMPSIPTPYMLFDGKSYIAYPRWSPDNQQLVYSSGITGNGDLYRISDLQSQISSLLNWPKKQQLKKPLIPFVQQQRLTNQRTGEEFFATWGKQPTRLIYQHYSGGDRGYGYDLSQLDLSESIPTPKPLEKVYDQIYPKISPDGTTLSFYYNLFQKRSGSVNQKLDKFALYTTSINDGQLLDLVENQVTFSVVIDAQKGPLWSPDSRHLIYIADNTEEKYPVYVINSQNRGPEENSQNRKRLTPEIIVNCTAVDLARTGKIVVFAAQEGAQQRLFLGITNFRSTVD